MLTVAKPDTEPTLAARLGELADQVDDMLAGGVTVAVGDSDEARQLIAAQTVLERKVAVLGVEVQHAVQRSGAHVDDGHASAKIMVRHLAKLSGPEAAARERCGRMLADLSTLAQAYRGGEIGTDQTRLLARVWSNPRVRGAMDDRQEWFVSLAKRLPYPRFEERVRRWESLTDQDGAKPANEVTHERRNAQLVQNRFDLSWDLAGRFGALDGATSNTIFKAYCDAEWHADWAEAAERLGPDAQVCEADLARTPAQRRADAMTQIFADAAANPEGAMPADYVHSIVWSADACDEMASRFDGNPPEPFDVDTFECRTLDGDPLEPYEAFANSLVNKLRRAVVDAKSVVIDLGEARRFRGSARHAVQVMTTMCFWPGCWVPVSACEIDHLHDHACRGRTDPGNGAPACGRHNRWKHKGYRVHRDSEGRIRVFRPDGTEIE